jgi:secondary thiamine-phosphate synthase enzyme
MIVLEEFDTKMEGRLDAVDVTDDLQAVVERSGIIEGSALVFSPHTTCCVVLAASRAHVTRSLAHMMRTVAPEDGYYAHDDLEIRTENLVEDEPANAPAHILHCVIGRPSECIPVVARRLLLGDEQRVLFVELDSSRPRRYCIQVMGEYALDKRRA